MNANLKRRFWELVFCAFVLWPLAQISLVQAYDISPWKFFGWGMYSEPKERPRVQVLETRGGQPFPREETELPSHVVSAIRYFEVRRFSLGRLAPPDTLADYILRAMPRWEGVTLLISRKQVDLATARIRTELESYSFVRDR